MQNGERNWTPLHWAAINYNINIVTLLLDAGADPTVLNEDGKTAEDIARERGDVKLADLLREAARARRLAEPVVTGIDWAAIT